MYACTACMYSTYVVHAYVCMYVCTVHMCIICMYAVY